MRMQDGFEFHIWASGSQRGKVVFDCDGLEADGVRLTPAEARALAAELIAAADAAEGEKS